MPGFQVNPLYLPQLESALALPQSVGIVGGRPGSSLYVVGCQRGSALYLDPHTVQQVRGCQRGSALYLDPRAVQQARGCQRGSALYLDPHAVQQVRGCQRGPSWLARPPPPAGRPSLFLPLGPCCGVGRLGGLDLPQLSLPP